MIYLLVLLQFFSFAKDKPRQLKVEHGDMIVEYRVVDDVKHMLILRVKIGKKVEGKEVYKQLQSIDLKLKPNEHLSIEKNFECFTKNKDYAYGVVTSRVARPDIPFAPHRAWIMNEKTQKLESAENPYIITCKFDKTEGKDYPFPPED